LVTARFFMFCSNSHLLTRFSTLKYLNYFSKTLQIDLLIHGAERYEVELIYFGCILM
jgi:hypothetical protein